jgi:mono/diheme cytochrome c family protein
LHPYDMGLTPLFRRGVRYQMGIIALVVLIVLPTLGALLLESNPPVKQEPPWDNPQTRVLAQRACFDCHSDETAWPLYTRLPVGSWLAVFDTLRGRRTLNFSEWGTSPVGGERAQRPGRVVEAIRDGSMPPSVYTLMHPEAVLSTQEEQQLIQGLQNSLK